MNFIRGLAVVCVLSCHAVASASVKHLDTLPMLVTDRADVAAAVAEAASQPRTFAVTQALSATVADGRWTLEADEAIWQLRVFSAGADQLALQLEDIALPADASLVWRTPEGTVSHHYVDNGDGIWWVPFVPGEWGLLEARLATQPPSALTLRIVAVNHGFDRSIATAKAAAPCNVDVICPQGNAWSTQTRATVRLTINNNILCSGVLVDNTARDGRPLVLTANHCGISANNARSVTALFNYNRSGCGSGTASLEDTVQGATLRGVSVEADTTLIELNRAVPSAFGARFAAWNALPPTEAIPQSGAALHHPDGDVKKISLFGTAARVRENVSISSGLLSGFSVDAWGVNWTQGTTQAGSSGGALFDQSGAVVGVLSGGSASCENLDGEDFFGRLERAFSTSNGIATTLDPVGGGSTRRSGSGGGGLPPITDGGGGGGGSGLSLAALMLGLWALRRRASALPRPTAAAR